MNDGYFGSESLIQFKCVKCGFVDPMPTWLADEILDLVMYKNLKVYHNACIKCQADMFAIEIVDQV